MGSGTETARAEGAVPRPARRWRKGPEADSRPDLPPARPALLPVGWVRVALLLLVAFGLFRGVLWADVLPAFWAPDEDYHFLYIDHIVTQGSLPDPDKPLYPVEYSRLADAIRYNDYGGGPRTVFEGDPKASLHVMSALPDSAREPTAIGRGVGVIHPPLYHLLGAAVDGLTGDAPMQTRLTWVRYLTALFGALGVYAAWLLAAQVIRDPRLQLFVPFLVAVQPMIGFLSGIANHDAALIAFFTLAVAMTMFVVRTPPRVAQGAWLGGTLVLALMVKASALALLPVAGLAFAAQAYTWRVQWRVALKAALLALGIVVVLAGWWYVRSRIVYGSSTGAVSHGGADPGGETTFGQLVSWAKEWTGLTYKTYWWHFQFYEAPAHTLRYYVPAFVGSVGIFGFLAAAWSERRRLFDVANPRLRQMIILAAAPLSLFVPFLLLDLQRRTDGAGFYLNGGRYLLPAFAAAATLFVIGIQHLTRREVQPLVFVTIGAIPTYFGYQVFEDNYLHRYFGWGSLGDLLHRISFDRPEFVTSFTLGVLLVAIVLTFAGFVAVVARNARRPVPATAE
jgi:hypothetical protein